MVILTIWWKRETFDQFEGSLVVICTAAELQLENDDELMHICCTLYNVQCTMLYNEPACTVKRSNGVALAVALGWSVGQAGIGTPPTVQSRCSFPLSGGTVSIKHSTQTLLDIWIDQVDIFKCICIWTPPSPSNSLCQEDTSELGPLQKPLQAKN